MRCTGPIQIFVLGFENFEATGRVAAELEALSDAGTIRVIDARFLLKQSEDELMAVRVTGEVDGSRVHSPAVKVTYSP